MNRRNFMSSILALAAAPAIVRAESLMPVRPIVNDKAIASLLVDWWADGFDRSVAKMLAPTLRLWSGEPSVGGILLAEFALPDPLVEGGRATFDIAQATAIGNGAISHFDVTGPCGAIVGSTGDHGSPLAVLGDRRIYNGDVIEIANLQIKLD